MQAGLLWMGGREERGRLQGASVCLGQVEGGRHGGGGGGFVVHKRIRGRGQGAVTC